MLPFPPNLALCLLGNKVFQLQENFMCRTCSDKSQPVLSCQMYTFLRTWLPKVDESRGPFSVRMCQGSCYSSHFFSYTPQVPPSHGSRLEFFLHYSIP